MADTTAAGARWRRVHVLSRPLTDYLCFEMVGYKANLAAGEDVRIADRGLHPELAALRRDFWLFDAEAADAFAMPLHYDAACHLTDFAITEDPEVIEQCRRERDLTIALSVPLHEYAALDA